jgi:hypothetical protein
MDLALNNLRSCPRRENEYGSRSTIRGKLRSGLQVRYDQIISKPSEDSERIKAANHKLLQYQASFWNLEGMTALLRQLSVKKIIDAHNRLYYHTGYFICAEI